MSNISRIIEIKFWNILFPIKIKDKIKRNCPALNPSKLGVKQQLLVVIMSCLLGLFTGVLISFYINFI